jgi:hypothetical protein
LRLAAIVVLVLAVIAPHGGATGVRSEAKPAQAKPRSQQFGSALPRLPQRPLAKSRRVVNVDSLPELKQALSRLRSGDRVIVEPGAYPGQLTIKRKQLRIPAQIIFKPGARMTGGARSEGNVVGLAVIESDNIWIRGGDFSHPEGDAIKIESSTNIVLNGSLVHDSGDSCVLVTANTRDNRDIWLLNVETFRCGNDRGDLATSRGYPPGYWRRGTHGVYYGSSKNGFETYGGAIVNFYGHDQPNGSILQVGDGARGLVVTGATLARATGDPTILAGNALNLWGEANEEVLWVNILVQQANTVLRATPATEAEGSTVRSLMYSNIASPTLFQQSSSGAPAIGQTWADDPRLGVGDVPALGSPAAGKAERAYLWPTDRLGHPRTRQTLGAFEVRAR